MPTAIKKNHSCEAPCARRHLASVATAIAVAGLLSACAANAPASPGAAPIAAPVTTTSAEDAVRVLAAARWQALIAGDIAKAYTFTAPSYRALNTLEAFRANKEGVSVKWISSNVRKVACEVTVCAVQIELESKPITPFPFRGTLNSALDEKWVLEEGKWWIFEKL